MASSRPGQAASVLFYFSLVLVAATSVAFGLDWMKAPLPPMPETEASVQAAKLAAHLPPPRKLAVAKATPRSVYPTREQAPARAPGRAVAAVDATRKQPDAAPTATPAPTAQARSRNATSQPAARPIPRSARPIAPGSLSTGRGASATRATRRHSSSNSSNSSSRPRSNRAGWCSPRSSPTNATSRPAATPFSPSIRPTAPISRRTVRAGCAPRARRPSRRRRRHPLPRRRLRPLQRPPRRQSRTNATSRRASRLI